MEFIESTLVERTLRKLRDFRQRYLRQISSKVSSLLYFLIASQTLILLLSFLVQNPGEVIDKSWLPLYVLLTDNSKAVYYTLFLLLSTTSYVKKYYGVKDFEHDRVNLAYYEHRYNDILVRYEQAEKRDDGSKRVTVERAIGVLLNTCRGLFGVDIQVILKMISPKGNIYTVTFAGQNVGLPDIYPRNVDVDPCFLLQKELSDDALARGTTPSVIFTNIRGDHVPKKFDEAWMQLVKKKTSKLRSSRLGKLIDNSRFAWKLLAQRCSDRDYYSLLRIHIAEDSTGDVNGIFLVASKNPYRFYKTSDETISKLESMIKRLYVVFRKYPIPKRKAREEREFSDTSKDQLYKEVEEQIDGFKKLEIPKDGWFSNMQLRFENFLNEFTKSN